MGFADMTDEIAIVTKAKENLVFAMASIDMETRRIMSSQLDEFVHKCSFNGKQCDIKNDFQFISDPTYGNCYTYNYKMQENLTSSRAGPMYGLRVLLYVNASEYMPTTEAAGVRLTIHTKQQYPFPDTFGYSAPTGYISSFGVRLRMIDRLPKPFGTCIPDGMTDDYIYRGYAYSTEGCYRSCFQNLVTRDCGCGDPRFPVVEGYQHCFASDPIARKCLDGATRDLGGMHGEYKCICQQPCKQSSFSVSYSASKWPSRSLKMKLDACTDEDDAISCVDHYKENGAMVEVFYEQLNYESLRESQAYGDPVHGVKKYCWNEDTCSEIWLVGRNTTMKFMENHSLVTQNVKTLQRKMISTRIMVWGEQVWFKNRRAKWKKRERHLAPDFRGFPGVAHTFTMGNPMMLQAPQPSAPPGIEDPSFYSTSPYGYGSAWTGYPNRSFSRTLKPSTSSGSGMIPSTHPSRIPAEPSGSQGNSTTHFTRSF